jgi:glycerol-3-phosphate cytidylyltransferase-like family protein
MNPRSYLGISPRQGRDKNWLEGSVSVRSSNLGRGINLGCIPKFLGCRLCQVARIMAIKDSKSKGQETQGKVRRVLVAILDYADSEVSDSRKSKPMVCRWADDGRLVVNDARANTIWHRVNADKDLAEISEEDVKRSFGDLVALQILTDRRGNKTQGASLWQFDLKFQRKERQAVLAEFDRLWVEKWPPPESKRKILTKEGVTKLPHNVPPLPPSQKYVARPAVLAEVKQRLLAEDEQPLVVRGLGGLGKSLLATAIARDEEVLEHFEDGVLWVTLGQKPTNLQADLGGWIDKLDKSHGSYSASTLSLAKSYLQNLLSDKRMLLVVDDVWNAADAEWFCVGGAGCRVLVTTRTAFIPDAELYPLPLMDLDESEKLMKAEIGAKWHDSLGEPIREFAGLLGCLPLAMKLMAVQVARGLNINNLKTAFLEETKRLSTLDYPRMKLENLSEDQLRENSLRACFGLSLKWLEPELLERFIWLGVLPEDVSIQQKMAMTLWDTKEWKAEEALLSLYESSLLMEGGETLEGNQTYRVHDLLHKLAQELIGHSTDRQALQNEKSEVDVLPGFGLTLPQAHEQLLERYKRQIDDCRWDKLPNDGYVHRHLTWHLVMARREDGVHELLGASDGLGQNAWFEACEEIGEPAIFVQDVARGWEFAEKLHDRDPERAIVLQARYALITATLNSLSGQLPVGMMAAFVKGGFWSVERAWAYVEQMQDQRKIADAIKALAVYFPKPLSQVALEKARSIQDEFSRANVLRSLAQVDNADLTQLLEAARSIQDEFSRANVLIGLAQIDNVYFVEAFETVRSIQSEYCREDMLKSLAQIDNADLTQLLEAARSIQSEYWRANVLISLAQVDNVYFVEALEATRSIQDESLQANRLKSLAQIDNVDFTQLLEAARLIQDESSRANVLVSLAQIDNGYFVEALEAARSIQDESSRANVLTSLAQINNAYFAEALDAVRSIQSESGRANVLISLAKIDNAYFVEALEAARSIQHESQQAIMLSRLAKVENADFTQLLDAARSIQDLSTRESVLSNLANLDNANFTQLLEVVRSIQDASTRESVLSSLAKLNNSNFTQLLEAARSIQDGCSWVFVLRSLAQLDNAYFNETLEATRSIQDESTRANVLISLVQLDNVDFTQLLEVARSIQDESTRANVLISLAQLDNVDFTQLLEAARSIQDESRRANVLISLAQLDNVDFTQLLEAARSIQDESSRANVLISLAQLDNAYLTEALEAARSIQPESDRANVLISLAQIDRADFTQLLEVARSIQSDFLRANVLISLAQIDSANFTQLLEESQSIKSEIMRSFALRNLAKIDNIYFARILKEARLIQHAFTQGGIVLKSLARINNVYDVEILESMLSIFDELNRGDVLRSLAQIDSSDFTRLLESARSIQSEYWRTYVLIILAQIDNIYFVEALEATRSMQDEYWRPEMLKHLAQIDNANFIQLLEVARSIQDESSREDVLVGLARIDNADFTQLFEAARSMRDESKLADVLSSLAQIDNADFTQLFEAARSIQDKSRRISLLRELAGNTPSDFLPKIYQAIFEITHKPTRAQSLSSYLPRLPLAALPYDDWQSHLHLLAHRKRADLMSDLATLYPAIIHLGGQPAMRGIVDEMKRICQQWP